MKPRFHARVSLVLLALGTLSVSACEDPSGYDRSTRTQTTPLQVQRADSERAATARALTDFPDELVLLWGAGEGQVGLVPGAVDRPPFPPLSAAVGPGGAVYLLDQVNGRVVELDAAGQWRRTFPAPAGPTDLAVDATGRPVVLSIVNHRLAVVEPAGVVDELSFPAQLPLIGGIRADASGQLSLTNGRQEAYRIGEPGAWIGWPDLLKTKREGLGDHVGGRPRQVMLREGGAQLLTYRGAKRPDTVALQGTQGVASVVLLASYPDDTVAVLLERWVGDTGRVTRSVARYEVTGELRAELDLPGQPIAFPHREFVVDDDGAVLQLLPLDDGLHLRVYRTGHVVRAGGAS